MLPMKLIQFTKFFLISVPLACLLYTIAVSLCKIKELCGKK